VRDELVNEQKSAPERDRDGTGLARHNAGHAERRLRYAWNGSNRLTRGEQLHEPRWGSARRGVVSWPRPSR